MFDFFKKTMKEKNDSKEEIMDENLENVDASVTFHVTKDGKYYVDFDIHDLEDGTINNLSKLLIQISKDSFYLEMLEIVKSGFENQGRGDIFTSIVSEITDEILKNLTEKKEGDLYIPNLSEKSKERPCFKPSDVL